MHSSSSFCPSQHTTFLVLPSNTGENKVKHEYVKPLSLLFYSVCSLVDEVVWLTTTFWNTAPTFGCHYLIVWCCFCRDLAFIFHATGVRGGMHDVDKQQSIAISLLGKRNREYPFCVFNQSVTDPAGVDRQTYPKGNCSHDRSVCWFPAGTKNMVIDRVPCTSSN